MSDIKMSDAFSGELKSRLIDSDDFSDASCNESFFAIEDDDYWCCSNESHINHAIHAINSHDKLTEQNKMLREALTRISEWDNMSQKFRIDNGSKGQQRVIVDIAEKALEAVKC